MLLCSQRCYRAALFTTAIERMQNRHVTTLSRLETLYTLSQQAQRIAEEKSREEMDLSDAPDEFRGRHRSTYVLTNKHEYHMLLC